jgi:hypothetical protein
MPLHRVVIFCSEPVALANFYCAAFRLEIISSEGTFIDTGIKDSQVSRLAFHKGKKASTSSIKLCFYTSDVAAERKRLVDLGANMGKLQGNAESLCFCDGTDLEGNVFQITNRA